jgi:uncharacterized protein (TIGR00661 family)
MPEKKKKILISPLNWGFGHTGRMIPVALRLQQMGHEVIFGADRTVIPMIKLELPGIEVIEIPGVNMHYSHVMPQYLAILFQTPKVVFAAMREHRLLKKLINEIKPDIVISDNRFGFFSKRVYSVYVTHMLQIPFPNPFRFLEFIGVFLHRIIINQYDICLIPDLPGEENLSGRLSHGKHLPERIIYAGLISRFATDTFERHNHQPYICLIISGPEPQRSILYEKVAAAACNNNMKLIVLSCNELKNAVKEENVTLVVNKPASEIQSYISDSSFVIGRSGYTTLMELISLSKGAIIIPTPGQTEQEYLGWYNNRRFGFQTVNQRDIENCDFNKMIFTESGNGFNKSCSYLLDEALNEVLKEENKRANH